MPERVLENATEEQRWIVANYRKIVGALNVMFAEIDQRMVLSAWRNDGIGSCVVPQREADKGLKGKASAILFALRDEKEAKTDGEHLVSENVCPYHRLGRGCGLGDLKSPACLGYIENEWEIEERFKLQAIPRFIGDVAGPLEQDINFFILKAILSGRGEFTYHASDDSVTEIWHVDDAFVESVLGAISMTTKHIKKFPILSEEDRQNYYFWPNFDAKNDFERQRGQLHTAF